MMRAPSRCSIIARWARLTSSAKPLRIHANWRTQSAAALVRADDGGEAGGGFDAPAAQAITRDLQEHEEGAVIGLRVFGSGRDDVGGPPFGDKTTDGFHRRHEQRGHALVGSVQEVRFRRLGEAEDGEGIQRLLAAPGTPAAAGFGIEKNAAFHGPLRLRIAVAIGEKDEAHLRADGHGLWHESPAAERFIIAMQREIAGAVDRSEMKGVRHGGSAQSVLAESPDGGISDELRRPSQLHSLVDEVGEQADEKHLHAG